MTFPDTAVDRIAWIIAIKEWHMGERGEREAATFSAIAQRAQKIKEQLLRRADEMEQELITLRAMLSTDKARMTCDKCGSSDRKVRTLVEGAYEGLMPDAPCNSRWHSESWSRPALSESQILLARAIGEISIMATQPLIPQQEPEGTPVEMTTQQAERLIK